MNKKVSITLDFGAGGTGLDALKKYGNNFNARPLNPGNPLKKPVGGNAGNLPCCPCCDDKKGGGDAKEKAKKEEGLFSILKKPAAAVAAALIVMKKSAEAFNIAQNSQLSVAQKNVGIAESLIPGFSIVRGFLNAIDGTTERIRAAGERMEVVMAGQSARGQAISKFSTARFGVGEFANRQGLRDAFPGYFGPLGDKTSVAGEQHYEDTQKRLEASDRHAQAMREQIGAQRDLKLAQRGVAGSENDLNAASGNLNAAQKERQRVHDIENAPVGPRLMDEDRVKAVNGLKIANQQLAIAEKQHEEEMLRYREKAIALGQAESNTRKSLIEEGKVELGILQAREQRMQATLQNLGKMNKGQYELAKSAAVALKKFGIENATQDMIDLASSIAPRMVNKMAENAAGGRAGELSRLGIDDQRTDFGDQTIATIRQQINNTQTNVRVAIELDQDAFAKRVTDLLNPFLLGFLANLKMQVETAIRETQINQQAKWANEH